VRILGPHLSWVYGQVNHVVRFLNCAKCGFTGLSQDGSSIAEKDLMPYVQQAIDQVLRRTCR
jgi:hypothetical protein